MPELWLVGRWGELLEESTDGEESMTVERNAREMLSDLEAQDAQSFFENPQREGAIQALRKILSMGDDDPAKLHSTHVAYGLDEQVGCPVCDAWRRAR